MSCQTPTTIFAVATAQDSRRSFAAFMTFVALVEEQGRGSEVGDEDIPN